MLPPSLNSPAAKEMLPPSLDLNQLVNDKEYADDQFHACYDFLKALEIDDNHLDVYCNATPEQRMLFVLRIHARLWMLKYFQKTVSEESEDGPLYHQLATLSTDSIRGDTVAGTDERWLYMQFCHCLWQWGVRTTQHNSPPKSHHRPCTQ